MEAIDQLVQKAVGKLTPPGFARIQYLPYKIDTALYVCERIHQGLNPDFRHTENSRKVYTKLIQYFHADPGFEGDLNKGLMLMGPTGTGKTMALRVMQAYRAIDNIRFFKDGVARCLIFDIYHVNAVVSAFINEGPDGLDTYCKRYVACLDDLGSELGAKYYGNELDVMGYVLAERQSRNLVTFATTNFPEIILEEKYGDRIMSRMHSMFNFITVNDRDFRRT